MRGLRSRRGWGLSCLLLVLATACGELRAPELPSARDTTAVEVLWTPQGWDEADRSVFHTLSQGTVTLPVPYDWLVALELPGVFEKPLLTNETELGRFGFLFDPLRADAGEPRLPVGFARVRAPVDPRTGKPLFVDPRTGEALDGVGFTCAACHTGQVTYRGKDVRIEGGGALTDLGKFRTTIGLSIVYTTPPLFFNPLPFRFDRFATRVLGEDHTSEQADALEAQMKQILAKLSRQRDERGRQLEAAGTQDLEEGFGRLDAIGRIGDQVFGTELEPRNYEALVAPVSFPHIWHTSWFDWVQWNGSIMQPMTRNAGEALGVTALVNLTNPERPLYASTIDVAALVKLEQLLAGDAPFEGLDAPVWPEAVLGRIDRESEPWKQGQALFQERCQGCHMAPARELVSQRRAGPDWVPLGAGGESKLYIRTRSIPLEEIGTDPAMALGMNRRLVSPGKLVLATANTPPVGVGLPPVKSEGCDSELRPVDGRAPFGAALAEVVENTVARWYDDQGVPNEIRDEMNGHRPNLIRAPLCYRARPLDGIWATPPFLHNGSVPTLYDLLGTEAERDARLREVNGRDGFWVGSREFDPEKVGLSYTELEGAFFLDTTVPGNLNSGHEFKNGGGQGAVGDALTEEQRQALVYYVKSL